MNMEKLVANVEQWAEERGILAEATPLDQFDKTMEEVGELEEDLELQQSGDDIKKNLKGSIKDDIGDITVTLIIQAKMQGLSFTDCLAYAWNEIKDRRGEMRGGQFVKEVEG
jgi:NTP pyrophosphatase (non-canonical NTP hydrolase)